MHSESFGLFSPIVPSYIIFLIYRLGPKTLRRAPGLYLLRLKRSEKHIAAIAINL